MSTPDADSAIDTLAALARDNALPWKDAWRAPIGQLLTWLGRFSARTNLVGDHRPEAVVQEHLLETLTVAAAVERIGLEPSRIVDVGAGAGLEVLMLALWADDAQLVAVEPRRKRADFIELVADAMGVGRRITVVRSQVPEWRPEQLFDLATSRATFSPGQWRVHAAALVAAQGVIVVHDAVTTAPGSPPDGGWQATERVVPGRSAHCIRTYRRASGQPTT